MEGVLALLRKPYLVFKVLCSPNGCRWPNRASRHSPPAGAPASGSSAATPAGQVDAPPVATHQLVAGRATPLYDAAAAPLALQALTRNVDRARGRSDKYTAYSAKS